MNKTLGIIAVASLFYGCTAHQPTIAPVEGLKACCVDYSEFTYVALAPERSTTVSFSDRSPVFEFPQGKSRFASYALPNDRTARSLEIETKPSSTWLPSATVVIPSFAFLDGEKKVRRVIAEFQVRQIPNFWTGPYYFARIPVEQADRYVVIYTDARALGDSVPFANGPSTQVFMAGRVPTVISGAGTTHYLPRDALGSLQVKLGP